MRATAHGNGRPVRPHMSVWFFYAAFPFLSPSHEVRERPRVGAYGAGEATDGWGPWRWDPHVGVERACLED